MGRNYYLYNIYEPKHLYIRLAGVSNGRKNVANYYGDSPHSGDTCEDYIHNSKHVLAYPASL